MLIIERIVQQVLADRQAVAVFRAAGAKGVDMPDVESTLARFDAMLAAEPRPIVTGERVLRSALGLSRAG